MSFRILVLIVVAKQPRTLQSDKDSNFV